MFERWLIIAEFKYGVKVNHSRILWSGSRLKTTTLPNNRATQSSLFPQITMSSCQPTGMPGPFLQCNRTPCRRGPVLSSVAAPQGRAISHRYARSGSKCCSNHRNHTELGWSTWLWTQSSFLMRGMKSPCFSLSKRTCRNITLKTNVPQRTHVL